MKEQRLQHDPGLFELGRQSLEFGSSKRIMPTIIGQQIVDKQYGSCAMYCQFAVACNHEHGGSYQPEGLHLDVADSTLYSDTGLVSQENGWAIEDVPTLSPGVTDEQRASEHFWVRIADCDGATLETVETVYEPLEYTEAGALRQTLMRALGQDRKTHVRTITVCGNAAAELALEAGVQFNVHPGQ
jgi:hypothetical protein